MQLLKDLGFELVNGVMYKDGEQWDVHTYEDVLADYGELELAHDLGELLELDVTIQYNAGYYTIFVGDEEVDIKEFVNES